MPLKTWDTKADFDAAYDISGETGDPGELKVGLRLHYYWGGLEGIVIKQALQVFGFLGPAAFGQRIVILGDTFGWLAEQLYSIGFTNIVSVDTSAWVQAELDNTEEADLRAEITAVGLDPDTGRGAQLLARHLRPGTRRGKQADGTTPITVHDEDVSTVAGRRAIRNSFPQGSGNPQIVISHGVLSSLTDQEAIDFSDDLQGWGGQQEIVHVVYTRRGTVESAPGANDGKHDFGYNWKTLAEWRALIPGNDVTFVDAVTGDTL